MTKPWERREGETDKAWQAFQFYLEERAKSQYDAYLDYCAWNWNTDRAEAERKKDGRKPPRHFEGWASEHDWSERREAYWRDVDRRAHEDMMSSAARRKVERVEMLDDIKAQLEQLVPFLAARAIAEDVSIKDFMGAIDKLMRHYREEFDEQATQKHEHSGLVELDGDGLADLLGVNFGDGEDG
jgi:hypothetical protein